LSLSIFSYKLLFLLFAIYQFYTHHNFQHRPTTNPTNAKPHPRNHLLSPTSHYPHVFPENPKSNRSVLLVLVQVHAVHRAEIDSKMTRKFGGEEVGELAHIKELFREREGMAMRM